MCISISLRFQFWKDADIAVLSILDFLMEGGGMRSTEEESSSLKHRDVSSTSAMLTGKINDLKTCIIFFAEFLFA